jgi:methionyl-tRNA formyltransferase
MVGMERSPLSLVFCGTPRFAVPTLEKLADSGFRIPLVVTQPDKPKGRGLELTPSPVKLAALRLELPLNQPEKIKNNDSFRSQLTELAPDAIIVVGYGRIIPPWMLNLPRLGNINLHASLLPKYRGAAPIQWAIARGESVTGNTTMRIDEGLDTGDILLQQEVVIVPSDTAETITPRMAALGADLVIETLHGLSRGTIQFRPQDDSQASLAPILRKEDGLIDFNRSAHEISNRLRGFQPWPGAFTRFRGKSLQVLAALPVAHQNEPGKIQIDGDHLLVGTGAGTSLELMELQLEGKKRTPARDFIHGYRLRTGELLGS